MTSDRKKRVLIIGCGGREYMVALKLRTSAHVKQLFYHDDVSHAKRSPLHHLAKFIDSTRLFDKELGIDYVFVGPERWLARGIVDQFLKVGIPCIGPTKALAQLETSKAFCRKLVEKYQVHIYNPEYAVFKPGDDQYKAWIEQRMPDIVIKPDGLHSGKGVKVGGHDVKTVQGACAYVKQLHDNDETVLLEEKLVGEEFTIMTFMDNNNIGIHMPPVQDFKRVYANDTGPQTGGMGSVTYALPKRLPFLSDGDIRRCQHINSDIVSALVDKIGEPYRGILYGSYMHIRNPQGGTQIKLIEFNVRFGDPECINVLALLETDLGAIFNAIIEDRLHTIVDLKFSTDACIVKYLVPAYYPESPKRIDCVVPNTEALVFAGLEEINFQHFITTGSRALAVIGKASTLPKALYQCHQRIEKILAANSKDTFRWRPDIGKQGGVYRASGVNMDEGNRVVACIQQAVESTYNNNTLSRLGDYSGLYALEPGQYEKPVLVSSTDGVGTKGLFVLKHYKPEKAYTMLGQDIVNHCVNDCLVKGAKPLFFLDYFARAKIDATHVRAFLNGVAKACRETNCVILGGETAEMPDTYASHRAGDIVGTIVGIVERQSLIDGKTLINPGDLVYGLPSSGPHTNGYSVIRGVDAQTKLTQQQIDALAKPHRCYLREIMALRKNDVRIHGLCHITGGGFTDNLPRVLPDDCDVQWQSTLFQGQYPPLFEWLQTQTQMSDEEMRRCFNCGVGMLVFVDAKDKNKMTSLKCMGCVVQKSPIE